MVSLIWFLSSVYFHMAFMKTFFVRMPYHIGCSDMVSSLCVFSYSFYLRLLRGPHYLRLLRGPQCLCVVRVMVEH